MQIELALKRAAPELVASPPVVARSAAPTRKFSPCIPRLLVIGASTGGPQALAAVLAELAPSLGSVPVLIVLHLPADFTGVERCLRLDESGFHTIGDSDCRGAKRILRLDLLVGSPVKSLGTATRPAPCEAIRHTWVNHASHAFQIAI